MTRRGFNGRERRILYDTYFGKCALCKCELEVGFHIDHIIPYSKGGKTDLSNAQPLCPLCNQKKSNKTERQFITMKEEFIRRKWCGVELPEWFQPRNWQNEAINAYQQKCILGGKSNFLLEACPGAGKTYQICATAYILKQLGLIEWFIICVPGDHLRRQLAFDAQEWGFDLYATIGTCVQIDYQGEVVTYAQLSSSKDTYKNRVLKYGGRVLIVADEVHHLGDQNTWGNDFTFAFNYARYRLFTTGTPFRSDNNKIVGDWINYEVVNETLECIPDYRYGYDSAVRDRVVRPVVFPEYEANVSFWVGDQTYETSFSEAKTKLEQSRCLQTALNPEGGWIKDIIKKADQRLLEIREHTKHRNAAGLIVCQPYRDDDGSSYAKRIGKLVHKLTGEEPTVVTYEDENASKLIEDFAEGGENAPRWIIAIKKVSEGVTIKRLRVCVFATNILTRMFFYQVMGRIIRVIPDLDNQMAYMYIPRHKTLEQYALEVKEAVAHLLENIDDSSNKNDGDSGEDKQEKESLELFMAGDSSAELDSHIFDGEIHGRYRIEEAINFKQQHNLLGYDEVALAKIMQEVENKYKQQDLKIKAQTERFNQSQKQLKHERIEHLKSLLKKSVSKLARLELNLPKNRKKWQSWDKANHAEKIKMIWRELAREFGSYNEESSEEVLQKKYRYVQDEIEGILISKSDNEYEDVEEEFKLWGDEELIGREE
jgi:superfamily II DNA or RNA helicase